jgi:hypothetical protein
MSDKRSVATDALETLGTIIGFGEKRDAIHLAVEPVVAAHNLFPGDDVGLLDDGRASTRAIKRVGIVDPFLSGTIKEGQRFWLVVYPRKITSLRHVWSHPDFAQEDDRAERGAPYLESRAWLESYANQLGESYEALMGAAKSYEEDGDYWRGGPDSNNVGSIPAAFWTHYSVVTGHKSKSTDGNFLNCCC